MEPNQTFNNDNTAPQSQRRDNQKKPDAYLGHVRILDANGGEHSYGKAYMPLVADAGQLERSLIAAARDAGEDDFVEVTIKARVNLAKVDDGTNLAF
jgi:hypothetical protein